MKFTRSALVAALFASSLVGCAAALQDLAKSRTPSRPAPNPLNGQPISYARAPEGHSFDNVTSEACTMWPIEDKYTLKASDREVCVDALIHDEKPTLMSDTVYVTSEGSQAQVKLTVNDSENRKLGTCAKEGRAVEIWEQHASGCASNANVVTAKAKHMALRKKTLLGEVDVAAWDLSN